MGSVAENLTSNLNFSLILSHYFAIMVRFFVPKKMDIQEFKKRIQQTVVLPEEMKKHFLGRADNYSQEKRAELIKELDKQESLFSEEASTRLQQIHSEKVAKNNQLQKKNEAIEKRQKAMQLVQVEAELHAMS